MTTPPTGHTTAADDAQPTGIAWNFTSTCPSCGKPLQTTNGVTEAHPDCPQPPALVIEGCNADTPLTERVEQALADAETLAATTAPTATA